MTKKSKLDLYGTLGVGKEAGQDEIKRAFRKKAKATHPDKGGDPAAFGQLVLANDVLKDQAKRQRYDETGEVPGSEPDNRRVAVLQIIAMAIDAVAGRAVSENVDVVSWNIAEAVRMTLRNDLDMLTKNREGVSAKKKKAEHMLGRFFRKKTDGQPNAVEEILTGTIRGYEENIQQISARTAQITEALDILKDYDFRKDAPPPIIRRYTMSSSTAW